MVCKRCLSQSFRHHVDLLCKKSYKSSSFLGYFDCFLSDHTVGCCNISFSCLSKAPFTRRRCENETESLRIVSDTIVFGQSDRRVFTRRRCRDVQRRLRLVRRRSRASFAGCASTITKRQHAWTGKLCASNRS